jgi:hypothetical protein
MTTQMPTPALLPESTHPYVVRVSLALGNNVEIDLSDEDMRLPFAGDYTIRIVKEQTNPREQANFIERISVHLEAFSSACEAERAGKLLVLSLLWVSASKRITIVRTDNASRCFFRQRIV